MPKHEDLLTEIRNRQQVMSEWNSGIITADRYVKTMEDCVGSDLCYRYACRKNSSYNDAIKRAAGILTHNNQDMVVDDSANFSNFKQSFKREDKWGDAIILPKNTLMVFEHTLTTPRKDRDGDILRTQGARPDPKMLMLWQHVHTLPIGKMLGVTEHNSKSLKLVSAIVDINELSHDAAVMIDNKMGRFSHGFRALDFQKVKEEDGKNTSPGGFDVKSFEILEESLVSVPANVDAETSEVLLSLVESKKLTSPILKGMGQSIRAKRPVTSAGGFDFENGPNKQKCGCGCGGAVGGCGKGKGSDETDASKEADDELSDVSKGKSENTKMTCEKCGSKMVDGICPKCGQGLAKDFDAEKAGRVLNSKNMMALSTARDHIKSVYDGEMLMTRPGRSRCKEAHDLVDQVVKSAVMLAEGIEQPQTSTEPTVKQATIVLLTKADPHERRTALEALQALEEVDQRSENTRKYLALQGRST